MQTRNNILFNNDRWQRSGEPVRARSIKCKLESIVRPRGRSSEGTASNTANRSFSHHMRSDFIEKHRDFYNSLMEKHALDKTTPPPKLHEISCSECLVHLPERKRIDNGRDIIKENIKKITERKPLKEHKLYMRKPKKLVFKNYDEMYFKVMNESQDKLDGGYGDYQRAYFLRFRSRLKAKEHEEPDNKDLDLFQKDSLYDGLPPEMRKLKDIINAPKLPIIEQFKKSSFPAVSNPINHQIDFPVTRQETQVSNIKPSGTDLARPSIKISPVIQDDLTPDVFNETKGSQGLLAPHIIIERTE